VNGVVITFMDRLLFANPTGVTDAERVLRVPNSWLLKYDQYAQLEQNLTSLAVAAQTGVTDVSLGSGSEAQPAQARIVTGSYFSVLGARPALGRLFHKGEERTSDDAVVLGYRAWRGRFGGAHSIVGSAIRIGDGLHTVIGVAPEGFDGVDPERVEFWLLIRPKRPSTGGLWLVGRLASGATVAQAESELAALYPSTAPILSDSTGRGPQVLSLVPVHKGFAARLLGLNTFVICLVGAAAVLLLVACANASGLLANRAFHRAPEIAIRMHLGAGRRHILRQLLMEIWLLSALAGIIAVPLVYWATPLLQRVLSSPLSGSRMRSVFPSMLDSADLQQYGASLLSVRVIVAMAVAVLVSSALSALAPTLYVLRSNLGVWSTVRQMTRPSRLHLRSGLVSLQVALTVVVVAATVLFMRSFDNAAAVAFGMELDNVLVMNMDVRAANSSKGEVRLFAEMSEQLRSVPQVTHVSTSLSVPIGTGRFYMAAKIPGRDWPWRAGARPAGRPFLDVVSPEYFDLLRIPIIEGRNFERVDHSGGPPVVIVNERAARDVFKGASALGHCVQFWAENTCRQIVGVVGAVRPQVLRVAGVDDGDTDPAFYVPAEQFGPGYSRHLLIRTASDPGPLIGVLRSRLHAIVPNAPYIEIVRLTQYRDQQLHGWRVASMLFTAVGLLALTLATIGVYSVLAFVVRQRTREIGIRLAVGATRRDIARDALSTGLKPVVIGALVGVLGAVSAAGLIRSLVFGIAATDVGSMVTAALVPTLAGLGASIIPAARASRVDPALSLRYE
jgi:putative ABC transport system permease protein